MNNKTSETTKKAERLITLRSQKWLCETIGITPHTMYKRLVLDNWKAAEITVIDLEFKKLKPKKDVNQEN
jgi:hypothetical protein